MRKIENRKSYQFFKHELEELLKAGFTIDQACIILKRMHSAINSWKGYHYNHIALVASESIDYLICQSSGSNKYTAPSDAGETPWQK